VRSNQYPIIIYHENLPRPICIIPHGYWADSNSRYLVISRATVLTGAENFTELAACEAEMTPSDWEGLGEVFVAALAVSDSDILAETRRIAADWEDKPGTFSIPIRPSA